MSDVRAFRWAVAVLLVGLSGLMKPAAAQEFRVYTRIHDESQTAGSGEAATAPPVVSRSLTLFHAGRVYDYIDGLGEVILFEPAHHRFTILSTRHVLATEVSFDEIRQMLKLARTETESHLASLQSSRNEEALAVIGPLRFQLDPQFQEKWDEAGNSVSLSGPYLSYSARTAPASDKGLATAYLDYADWTCRLNYVLHPGRLMPAPRLMLNQALREKDRLPVEVTLTAEVDQPMKYRAEHRLHWELDAKDRSLIHHWETLLKSDTLRKVTFREYQHEILSRKVSRRR